MPISKIGSKALVDCSVAAVDIADNSITAAKLAGSIANAKLANSSVTINSTSVSLGASANINALDWQSVIVADGSTGTTGVAGRGYFINTTSAAHIFTLPVSATRGDTIAIKDYAGTFATFNLTIARNGHKIQGVENNSLISTNRASVVLVYVDVTRGWEFVTESNVGVLVPVFISATGGTVATSGDFKIHTFTGDGCFVVATAGNPSGSDTVDYLVVAGGGGGGGALTGTSGGAGGGGAGGYRESSGVTSGCYSASPLGSGVSALSVSATTYPITVGGGGSGNSASPGTNGSNSVFSTITSTGGGGGGSRGTTAPTGNGNPGGSGGGAGHGSDGAPHTAGSGNTPPTSPSQGNPGASFPAPGPSGAGGGGGASGAATSGNGAAGVTSSINTTPTARAGGGGGASGSGAGTGGSGGGGDGNSSIGGTGSAGTVNTGGGGGGSGNAGPTSLSGAAGGSGIVIIRYKFQ